MRKKNEIYPLLNTAEIRRLERYIVRHGGQEKVAVGWGTCASTLSRAIHRHHGPSPMLRAHLEAHGIIRPSRRIVRAPVAA